MSPEAVLEKEEPAVDVGQSLERTWELDGTVSVREETYEDLRILWIKVGNTGLGFTWTRWGMGRGIWEMNFMPEGEVRFNPDKWFKYSLVFAFAMYRFLEWLESQGEDYRRSIRFPKVIKGETNLEMLDFRKKLFATEGKKQIFVAGRKTGRETVNHKTRYRFYILRLLSNAHVRAKLERYHDECEKRGYRMETVRFHWAND